jgi:hypothetical protein
MITLPLEFSAKGWSHKQLMRQGNVALYHRWRIGKEGNAAEEHYEVILVRQKPACERFGKSYPAAEHYPSAHSWGERGWTFLTEEKAVQKFNQKVALYRPSERRTRFEAKKAKWHLGGLQSMGFMRVATTPISS